MARAKSITPPKYQPRLSNSLRQDLAQQTERLQHAKEQHADALRVLAAEKEKSLAGDGKVICSDSLITAESRCRAWSSLIAEVEQKIQQTEKSLAAAIAADERKVAVRKPRKVAA